MLLIMKANKVCLCGWYFETLVAGGRGGIGQIVGCRTCGKVYRRDSGEHYTLMEGKRFSDYAPAKQPTHN